MSLETQEAEEVWAQTLRMVDYLDLTLSTYLERHSKGCDEEICRRCAALSCPLGAWEHFWKDGCPACHDKLGVVDLGGLHPFRTKAATRD